jgi:hypothetical protein
MLNALEVGTRVPIHRHLMTSETVVCLEGCLDWVFYEEMAGVDTGGPVHDGETAADETQFVETARFRVCPRDVVFGIQVPQGAWHSIEVHEASMLSGYFTLLYIWRIGITLRTGALISCFSVKWSKRN